MTSVNVALLLPPHGDELASSSLRPVVVSWEGTAASSPTCLLLKLTGLCIFPAASAAFCSHCWCLTSVVLPVPTSFVPASQGPLSIMHSKHSESFGWKGFGVHFFSNQKETMAIIMNIYSWLILNDPHLYRNTVPKCNFFVKIWICSSVSCFVFLSLRPVGS